MSTSNLEQKIDDLYEKKGYSTHSKKILCPKLEEMNDEFEKCCEEVRHWKKIKPIDPEYSELYAYYKQATSGDYDISSSTSNPTIFESNEAFNKKHLEWMKLKGMSKEQAKKKYIELTNKYRSSKA